jgi:hypothetical protein
VKALKIGGVLIVVYLIGAKATSWGKLLINGGTATSTVVKTFQGR